MWKIANNVKVIIYVKNAYQIIYYMNILIKMDYISQNVENNNVTYLVIIIIISRKNV